MNFKKPVKEMRKNAEIIRAAFGFVVNYYH